MSNLFVWDAEKYSLKIGPMDADHQEIIARMNRLHELHDARADKSQLARALADLITVTVRHFADEEVYMARIGFPDVSRHKLIHKALLEQMREHQVKFEASGKISDELFSFLSFWLKSHICGIDTKYSTFSRTVKAA